jgi:type IV pilus assembly protein PilQ
MYTRLIPLLLAIFSAITLSLVLPLAPASAADQAQGSGVYEVSEVVTDIDGGSLTMLLKGSSAPAYTVSERFGPYRLVVDIADAEFSDSVDVQNILPANDLAKLHLSIMKDQKPAIARLEFTLNDNSSYEVQRIQNNLQIIIQGEPGSTIADAAGQAGQADKEDVSATLFETPVKEADLLQPSGEPVDQDLEEFRDSFSFSGYKNERISVDFYKIDLHNVFRLFRQISDLNIIVDESVQGSVTIALNDVPWDFALDIILNLADLKKEERFNTIVIYPKEKDFRWPERGEDNLTFEADVEVVREEALIIQQSASQPAEIMQAKELLIKGREAEKEDNYEDAALIYEQAALLWPDNSKISNKLANMYLGRLNMNAKALYFAEKTLEKNPADTQAALYAAIASANMGRVPEALEFFAQSVSGDPPRKEALVSYASFSENNNQPEAALKLIDTYAKYYGEDLLTMVAKARLLDKMGETDKATNQYRAILTSGFQMRPDLKGYIQKRVAGGN